MVVKLSTTGSGPPVREPMFNEDERKAMMMAEHRRREEVRTGIAIVFHQLVGEKTSGG